ncbi:hypothetical protein HDU98_007075 [Podochytrium sp. JEL0797]|nr:hypothetical protein HDU98_007075 [Podochytrium sp. JEL0797]
MLAAFNAAVKTGIHAVEDGLHAVEHVIGDLTGLQLGPEPVTKVMTELELEDGHPIKHFVVICMENHSFDNLFGWWAKNKRHVNGIPPGAHNVDSKTGKIWYAKPNATYVQEFDPDHETAATTQQIYGMAALDSCKPMGAPSMSGFVDQAIATDVLGLNDNDPKLISPDLAAETVMSGYTPSQIPIFCKLAEEFALFDAWHAGIPGPTFPNRVFLASATSNGMSHNDNGEFVGGLPQPSLFKMFENKGLSSKNYYGQIPTGLIFDDFRGLVAEDTLHLRPGFHTGNMAEFKADAEAGKLPHFSWIDPIFVQAPGFLADDMHPPHDVARGEALIKEIYETLRASPQWEETALLITFDEHGGFYDHVVPPTNVPCPDKASADNAEFKFDRLGLRVPTLLISAHTPKGVVYHDPITPAPEKFAQFHTSKFDHSSLVHSMNDMFNLDVELNERAQWSGSFAKMFTKAARTDCPVALPDAPVITEQAERYDEKSQWTSVIKTVQGLF